MNLEALKLDLSYLKATKLKLIEVCYQIRYNGANFDFELLNDNGDVVLSESIDWAKWDDIHDGLVNKMLDDLEDCRYDRVCSSEPLKEFCAQLGLSLVDVNSQPYGPSIEFEIGHDS